MLGKVCGVLRKCLIYRKLFANEYGYTCTEAEMLMAIYRCRYIIIQILAYINLYLCTCIPMSVYTYTRKYIYT